MILKYLKSFIYILVPFFISIIISTIINYFDLIDSDYIKYIDILLVAISMFIGGLYLGKNSTSNGWLEGLKIGSIVVLMFLILTFIIFSKGINYKMIIYYIILISSSMFGGIIGINKKQQN